MMMMIIAEIIEKALFVRFQGMREREREEGKKKQGVKIHH